MNDVTAEEILEMLTRMNAFKVSRILNIPLEVIYQKLDKYEEETGKKIGNINNLRKRKNGMPAERLLKLYRSGTSIEDIAREKRMRVETVKKILRNYFEENGEEIPEDILKQEEPKTEKKQKDDKSKKEKEEFVPPVIFSQFQKDIIYLYYNKDKSPQEIIDYFAEKGKELTIADILDTIDKQHKAMSAHRKKKTEIVSKPEDLVESQSSPIPEAKSLQKKSEETSIDVDKIIRDEMLLKGISLKRWTVISNHADCLEQVKKRLEQLKIVASQVRKTDTGYISDDAFLDVLNLLENPNLLHPYDRFMVYLKQYVSLRGICEFGKIDVIKNKIFNNNKDLTTYVLSGLDLKFKGYDLNVWENSYRKKYIEKIDLYIRRLQSVDIRRRESKQKADNKDSTNQVKLDDDKKEIR